MEGKIVKKRNSYKNNRKVSTPAFQIPEGMDIKLRACCEQQNKSMSEIKCAGLEMYLEYLCLPIEKIHKVNRILENNKAMNSQPVKVG